MVGAGWTGPSWLSFAVYAKSGSWESRFMAVGDLDAHAQWGELELYLRL
jgi:hypothetical protein